MKSIKSNMSKNFDVKSALRKRGYVVGEGGIDQIPAKLTRGEAVLPRETVEALGGPEGVDELILRTTGKRSAPKMVDGELHAVRGWDGSWLQGKLNSLAETVGRATSPKSVEQAARAAGETVRAGVDAAKDMGNAFKAGVEAGPAPAADAAGPKLYDPKTDRAYQGARKPTATLVKEAGGVISNTQPTFGNAPNPNPNPGLRGRIGGMLAATAMEAPQAYEDMTTPGMTNADRLARGAESASRLASSWLGMKAGGAVGTALGGPFAWATGPLGALAGGGLGYFAPDLVSSGVKAATGSEEPVLPSERAAALRSAAAAKPPVLPGQNFGNAQGGMRSTAKIAGMPDFSNVQSGATSGPMSGAGQKPLPGRNLMDAYANESALRRQMVQDQQEREYNPGTGVAEYMPETDMFGQSAAQRSADMDRFDARVALGRIGQGAGKQYVASRLAIAEGLNKLAEGTLADEQRTIAAKKEGVVGALNRDAGLRISRENNRTELDKTADVTAASRYRDDSQLKGDIIKTEGVIAAADLRAQGDVLRARAELGDKAAKLKLEERAAGARALSEDLAQRYGDVKKDPAALQRANDVQRLLLGTMAEAGYGPELLTDPRIKEALIYETEQAIETRDSGRGIIAALKRLIDPQRREVLDSPVGSDYNPQRLRQGGITGRAVETKAGTTDEAVHEYGDRNAGILSRLNFDRLRRKKYADQIDQLLRNSGE